ncbi:MAG: bifunctional riboflavin kinase/FAD synthetase [Ferruginibacter sp.]
MNVYHDIDQLPVFKNAVVTIGTFDGVHKGHQQIIDLMKKEAAAAAGETVIISFNPHPRQVIGSKSGPLYLINTLEEKITLLEKYGIQNLVIAPFTTAFSNQPADNYIADFLVKKFHPHTIIIGHDHHFGRDRSGNYALLEEKAAQFNYSVKEIPEYMLQDITISSTKIRTALIADDIVTANNFLGYDYFFSGIVVEGNKLGRTIGYPTANLQVEDENKLIPGNGVYAVVVERTIADSALLKENINSLAGASQSYRGMMNIGVRPTVDGTKRVIEVNIFDFNKDIYGEQLTIRIRKHLRNEQKFSGLDALKAQLAKDKEDAIAFLPA